MLRPDYISGLTLLGGEPFEPENQPVLLDLLRQVRAAYPHKTVWAYSGYTYEQLTAGTLGAKEITDEFLSLTDVLVDGEFVASLKNLNLRFRGSSNQRIIDLQKTRQCGELTLWDDGEMKGR